MKGGGALLMVGGLAAVAGLVLWSRSSGAKPAQSSPCDQRKAEMLALGNAWIARMGELCAGQDTAACRALGGMMREAAELRDRATVKACNWAEPSAECQALAAEATALSQKWVPALIQACPAGSTDPACVESLSLGMQLRPMAQQWLADCAPAPVAKVPVQKEVGAPVVDPRGEALAQAATTGIGVVVDL